MNSHAEWLTIKELETLQLPGLKGSFSTIHRKAKQQGWVERRREGVKGIAYEYHVSSLPQSAQVALGAPLKSHTQSSGHSVEPISNAESPSFLQLLIQSLTTSELSKLEAVLKRKGSEFFLELLDEDNFYFFQLHPDEKQRVLRLAKQMREGDPADSKGNKLAHPTHKKAV